MLLRRFFLFFGCDDGTPADATFYICLGTVPPPPPAPATEAELTLTVTLLEVTATGVPELSVT